MVQLIQTLSPALDGLMKAASSLGTIEFYIVLIPAVYWVADVQTGFRTLLLLIGADYLSMSCKQIFRQPRPYWVGGVKQLATETSYGFTSSHSSDSMAVWGGLAYWVKKDWLWILSTFLVLIIGLSRMYLAVHFPQDVLGGWLVGLLVLVAFAHAEAGIAAWFYQRSTAIQIAVGFGASILIILTGALIHLLTAALPDPVKWAAYSTQAREVSDYFTLAGALFGTVAGYIWMRGRACFRIEGPGWQRASRYCVGIAGLLIIYLALDVLFSLIAGDETPVGYILRYIRYASVTFWAMFGAPWVFLKLKLARAG